MPEHVLKVLELRVADLCPRFLELLCQFTLGALNVWLGEHGPLIVAHLTTGTLLWAAVISITYKLAWLPSEAPSRERVPRAEASAAAA